MSCLPEILMVGRLMRTGMPTFRIAVMPFSTIRVLIELDPECDPISGTLQPQPDGEPTHFTGWLQLTQALESMRQSPTHDRARHGRGEPPNPR
jgi:hypothetical protein